MKVSLIINNYNYGCFVGEAIESALAIEWGNKEIIVVDDGSTDHSRTVIEAFGDRIVPVFLANGGQAKAANAGFDRATGDIVIFLDADDMLLPTVAQQIVARWHPGIAKVQYSMIYVDAALRPLGRQWPAYTAKHTPEWAARSMRESGNYLSSPTSGNAWSRDFLREIFPLPTRDQGLHWIDMYLHMLAPFFGEVVSLTSPQCLYRRHGENDSGSALLHEYLARYPRLMTQFEITKQLADDLLERKGCAGLTSHKNEYYAKVALVSKRFFPDRHPSWLPTLLLKYWHAAWRGEYTRKWKAMLFIWSLAVVAAPRPVAGWVVFRRDGHARAHLKTPQLLHGRMVVSG
jgi:glycosyltransferase involved in cell wall biosynthesis